MPKGIYQRKNRKKKHFVVDEHSGVLVETETVRDKQVCGLEEQNAELKRELLNVYRYFYQQHKL